MGINVVGGQAMSADALFSAVGAKRVLDRMQVFHFWLMDITLAPSPVFLPILGFSAMTAPSMSSEFEEVKEGNWPFPRQVISRATVEPITLSRGVLFYDSDFWKWITQGITGDPGLGAVTGLLSIPTSVRRNLLLIHYLEFAPLGVNDNLSGANGRFPGKAYVLHQCLPGKYKSGTDFDAKSSEISIAELEIKPEFWEEYSVSS